MTVETPQAVERAWSSYKRMIALADQLWEAYELEFLSRYNASTVTPEPMSLEATDDSEVDDFPF